MSNKHAEQTYYQAIIGQIANRRFHQIDLDSCLCTSRTYSGVLALVSQSALDSQSNLWIDRRQFA